MVELLPAGELDRRLAILAPSTTFDDAGGQVTTWSTLLTVWASRQDTGGGEAIRGGQQASEIDVRFRIRPPSTSIDATMRVREGGKEFAITRIAELPGRNVGYEILAKSLDETGAI